MFHAFVKMQANKTDISYTSSETLFFYILLTIFKRLQESEIIFTGMSQIMIESVQCS